MRIIPVIDVQKGQTVRAVAGNRLHYLPLRTNLHESCDPFGIAQAYRDQLGLFDIYMADLDAIAGSRPNLDLIRGLVDLGLNLWLDAGLRDTTSLPPLLHLGVSHFVAGLESVRGPGALADLLAALGRDSLVFSLDLYAGEPRVAANADWSSQAPLGIADEAIGLGVRHFLLLDLARVGTGRGVGTLSLFSALAGRHLDVSLTAGGGIARRDDLDALEAQGAAAVLVGSALHDGRIRVRDGSVLD